PISPRAPPLLTGPRDDAAHAVVRQDAAVNTTPDAEDDAQDGRDEHVDGGEEDVVAHQLQGSSANVEHGDTGDQRMLHGTRDARRVQGRLGSSDHDYLRIWCLPAGSGSPRAISMVAFSWRGDCEVVTQVARP